MGDIGFKIYHNRVRPDLKLLEYFKLYSTPLLGDAMERFYAMSYEIKPVFQDVKMVGSALTVRTSPADNLLIHKALDLAEPNDVIVIDSGGDKSRALLGELMCRTAIKKGLAGLVVDGLIRDCAELRKLRFPVFAKGVMPGGPYKDGPGEINVPINCGGVVVKAGDIIVGDDDGVVVISPTDAIDILKKAAEQMVKEKQKRKEIETGTMNKDWIDKTLRQKGCKYIF